MRLAHISPSVRPRPAHGIPVRRDRMRMVMKSMRSLSNQPAGIHGWWWWHGAGGTNTTTHNTAPRCICRRQVMSSAGRRDTTVSPSPTHTSLSRCTSEGRAPAASGQCPEEAREKAGPKGEASATLPVCAAQHEHERELCFLDDVRAIVQQAKTKNVPGRATMMRMSAARN